MNDPRTNAWDAHTDVGADDARAFTAPNAIAGAGSTLGSDASIAAVTDKGQYINVGPVHLLRIPQGMVGRCFVHGTPHMLLRGWHVFKDPQVRRSQSVYCACTQPALMIDFL